MSSELRPLHPYDEYNQLLGGNVSPPHWKNPIPQRPYHLVVIGAGTAGLVTAAGAAGLGARVALIERALLGGDCLNVGCVPSKGMIRAARVAMTVRDAAPYGITVQGETRIDFGQVMQRMRRLRANISLNDSAQRFTELGVDVFLGTGSFIGHNRVAVTGGDGSIAELQFRKGVIATGARASAPPISGLDAVNYLTNETLFSLTELPRRFGIIGSGPIGCEMAQTFARLGSEVYLFERGSSILPREDVDASTILKRHLEHDGVRLLLAATDMKISPENRGTIRILVRHQGELRDIVVDQLLVAVGRAPNIDGLNLGDAGVKFDPAGVWVNDFLQTTNPRIFAAGDICSQYKFTHAADSLARIVIQNSLFALGPFGRRKASDLLIPWATYTSPEIAHVGMYEHDADEAGIKIDTYTQSLSHIDRAILDGQDDGFVRVHTRRGTDRIVGATVVAENAGDLISEITLAMVGRLGLATIGTAIHPYPTQSEAIRKLGDQFNRTRLTPMNRFLLRLLRRWNVGR